MNTDSWSSLFYSLFGTPKALAGLFADFSWIALALSVLTPVLLLYARREILLKRLRAILDFMYSFQMYNGKGDFSDIRDEGDDPEDTRDARAQDGSEKTVKSKATTSTVRYNPSFEFVKSKYVSDINVTAKEQKELEGKTEEDKLQAYINIASEKGTRSDGRIYFASVSFMLVCYFGFKAIIGAFDCNFASVSDCAIGIGSVNQQMLVVGALAFVGAFVAALRMLLRALALFDLSAFSFLRHSAEIIFSVLLVMLLYRAFPDPFFNVGKLMLPDSVVAQLSQIEAQQREILRTQQPIPEQDAAQDDTSKAKPAESGDTQMDVVKASPSVEADPKDAAESDTADAVPVDAGKAKKSRTNAAAPADDAGKKIKPADISAAAPKGETANPKTVGDQGSEAGKPHVLASTMGPTDSGIPWLWFALAPVLGLLPASSTKFLLIKMQSLIAWIKTTDDRFMQVSKSVSLDVIDGIDFETRFRLEECGIYDVQNLATYNPVMLHIETPNGIYQTIDWVAQAQLCHIVGLEKFLMFRELNIRTIFDLERAIDSIHSPEVFDDIYASILFAPTSNLRNAAQISQFKFLVTDGHGLSRQVSVEEYCTWVREQIRKVPGKDSAAGAEQDASVTSAVEHLMAWISDDLHIRRLRRLWLDISESLGEKAEYFPDSKRRHARKNYVDARCKACMADKETGEKKKLAEAADDNSRAIGQRILDGPKEPGAQDPKAEEEQRGPGVGETPGKGQQATNDGSQSRQDENAIRDAGAVAEPQAPLAGDNAANVVDTPNDPNDVKTGDDPSKP